MKNESKISNFEFGNLNFFITRALMIGVTFNALINSMKQDSWLIPILSVIPAIILIIAANYIMKYKPDLDLSLKIIELFKKKLGIFIIILFILLFGFICILNFLNLNNFIQSQFLTRTPFIAISIMFMIATYYILNKGISVIARCGTILMFISIILFILSLIGLMPQVKISNIKPIFTSSPYDYITGLNSFYAFNTLPLLLLTIIPKNKIKNENVKKTLLISYFVSMISLFVIIFQTIAVFGYELSNMYEYPQFLVLKHVSLVGLSSRIESILIMQVIFDILILNIFIIYFIGRCIKSTFNIKRKDLIYFIICISIIFLTIYISKYNVFLDNLIRNIIPITISIASTFLIILICIKIKMSKN